MRTVSLSRGVSLPAITLGHLWALAAPVGVFIWCSLGTIYLGDFWWHLRLGQEIVTTGRIPSTDVYSFTAAGQPYVYQQWFGEVYLYLLYAVGGLELAFFANALTLATVAALMLILAYESGGNLRVASICTMLGVMIALPNRDVRPQVLGFLFFGLFYFVLTRYRRGRRSPIWILPPLAALWSNVHGSAILGLGLCGLVLGVAVLNALLRPWSGEALPRRRLAMLGLVTAANAAAMLANPVGAGFYRYILTIQSNPVIQQSVTEWFPPSFGNPQNVPFFLFLLACAALFALSSKPLDLTDTAVFVVFSILALQAVRNSSWFGFVMIPIAAGQLSHVVALSRGRRSATVAEAARDSSTARDSDSARARTSLTYANLAFAGLLICLALLVSPWVKTSLPMPPKWEGLVDPDTPVEAVAYLRSHHSEARVFNPDVYGGYMIWAAPGNPPVFVDGRIELYPLEVWQDYIQISLAQDWENRLAKYRIEYVLIPRSHSGREFHAPLAKALSEDPEWVLEYEDAKAALYVKRR